jgi:hypothetical protein
MPLRKLKRTDVTDAVGQAVEDERAPSYARDTADLILHSVSITLSLILVGAWNSFIFAQLGRHVFSRVPGLEDRGSLPFLVFTTVFVAALFVGLSWATDGDVAPKRIFAGVGAKPFVPGLDVR